MSKVVFISQTSVLTTVAFSQTGSSREAVVHFCSGSAAFSTVTSTFFNKKQLLRVFLHSCDLLVWTVDVLENVQMQIEHRALSKTALALCSGNAPEVRGRPV